MIMNLSSVHISDIQFVLPDSCLLVYGGHYTHVPSIISFSVSLHVSETQALPSYDGFLYGSHTNISATYSGILAYSGTFITSSTC